MLRRRMPRLGGALRWVILFALVLGAVPLAPFTDVLPALDRFNTTALDAAAAVTDGFDFPFDEHNGYDNTWDSFAGYNKVNTSLAGTNFDSKGACYGKYLSQLRHSGEDWPRTKGSNVRAVANGTVVYAAYVNYPGSVVIVQHTLPGATSPWGTNTIFSMYGHLADATVRVGMDITRGTVVGHVLDQGSNSHLHFEMREFKNMDFFCTAENVTGTFPPGPGYTDTGVQPDSKGYTNPSNWVRSHRPGSGVTNQAMYLSFTWGYNTSTFQWEGMNRARYVYLEVRNPGSSTDRIAVGLSTDGNGTYNSWPLSGLASGMYDIYLKPNGFLRQKVTQFLNTGGNSVFFSMTRPGSVVCNGGTTTTHPLAGDIDGNNVVNAADYNLGIKYFTDIIYKPPPPPQYVDIDGNNKMDEYDLNLIVRTMCFFGKGYPPAAVGDGGVVNGDINVLPPGTSAVEPPVSTAALTGTMTVYSPSYTARQLDTVEFRVYIDTGGASVDGADAVVHYDPAIFRVVSIANSGMFPSAPTLSDNHADGEIRIAVAANQNSPISGQGNIVSIQMQIVGEGATQVTLDRASGARSRSGMWENPSGEQIAGTFNDYSFTALGGIASLDTYDLDFGSARGGQVVSRTVTLRNIGSDWLTNSAVSLTTNDGNQFSIASQNCTSQPVYVGASCTVTVNFLPTRGGQQTATLAFSNDAAFSGTIPSIQEVDLTANVLVDAAPAQRPGTGSQGAGPEPQPRPGTVIPGANPAPLPGSR